MAARCTNCGEVYLPPRPLCPGCYQAEMEWVELSGAGRLEGFTIIYVGLPGMNTHGYSRQNPYCSGVVRLPEGPALTAQILSGSGTALNDIRVGAPLHAVFVNHGDSDQVVLAFEVNGSTGD